MAVTALEPISPELVLVCPELAAAARARLPDRDPDAFAFGPAAVAAPRPPVWTSALVYTAARFAELAVWSALWVALVALLVTVPLLL